MILAADTFLGPYRIVAPIGSGGMGEVYRARDSRLNRDVAIKVLAPHMAADTTALLRFEREAQALAALSHPGIVAIYDVGRHESSAYVVMEFLDGETLRMRLASGPIVVRKAVDYGVQMAYALAAAHDRGIVHRDLKPENVFLCGDGRVKVLDFGIAQLASASAAMSADTAVVPERATAPRMMVGTVGYMAPEQARAQPVDARADIFALGAVLHEMLSGRHAFEGDTAVDVLTAVLHSDPPELSPDLRVPPGLERIVRRCLEKRADERFQSARDLAFALEGVSSGSATVGAVADAPSRRVPWWAVAAAAALALAAGFGAGRLVTAGGSAAAPLPAAVRFVLEASRSQVPEVAVSPNGRYIAWTEVTRGGRVSGVSVRRLDATAAALLPDTPSTGTPFWSPDGREIVVLDDDDQALVAIDVERGDRRVFLELDESQMPFRGGDWLGQTLVLGLGGTISVQDLSGRGARRAVTRLAAPREAWHGWPLLLPGGRRFLYTVILADGGVETRIGAVDGGASTTVALPANVSRVRLDARGYLVFAQNRVLLAQRFDMETGALLGSPIRLASEVFQNPSTGWTAADVSRNGVLVWRAPGVDDVQFESVDRSGRTVGVIGRPDAYTNFDVSPDGTRIVASRRRSDAASSLFLLDPARMLTTPISDQSNAAPISDPTWSPDGRQIAYRRGGNLVVRNVFGGEERVLTDWAGYPDSWSRDGTYLIVGRAQGPDYQLWAIAMNGGGKDVPLVQGVPLADEARFSPDGKWVVFHAAVQGAPQVFAIRFPPTGERWQLSTDGGVQPRWRSDGRELYYLGIDGQVMVVAMPEGDPTRARSPESLFALRLQPSTAFDQFAPLPDGQRFIVRRPLRPGGADTAQVHVMVNWDEAAGNRAPR